MEHQPQELPRKRDAPDLLVCTRFGLRVRDRGWLAHRLALISSITAPSLMSQQDQNFHWVILIDDGLPHDICEDLEDLISPLGERASLYRRKHENPASLVEVAEDRLQLDDSSFLLTGRIDDDDAWSVTMVEAVRKRVASWLEQSDRAPVLSLTFQDGLEWVMYEMLDVEKLMDRGERFVHAPAIRRYSFPFLGMSVFVCSRLSDGMTAMAGPHQRVAERLSSKKGFATEVIPTNSPMWLCCRHKQTGSGIRNAQGAMIDLTLNELTTQFGLDHPGVQSYLDRADEYQYNLVKAPLPGRVSSYLSGYVSTGRSRIRRPL
jgi:hypothetical protein